MPDYDYNRDKDFVEKALAQAANLGLMNEVVTTALWEMKVNPYLSLEDALNTALKEWDI